MRMSWRLRADRYGRCEGLGVAVAAIYGSGPGQCCRSWATPIQPGYDQIVTPIRAGASGELKSLFSPDHDYPL
jgi:hypothetical protein